MHKRYDQDPCPSCGSLKRKHADLCSQCRTLLRRQGAKGRRNRPCVDCGIGIADKGGRAKRCWNCWSQYRLTRPRKPCSVEGCQRPHRAKSYCIEHYQQFLQPRATGDNRGKSFLNALREMPCQLCSYSKLRSHTHRIVEGRHGGRYEAGNVVALCARCHEEVHRGITSAPEPISVNT